MNVRSLSGDQPALRIHALIRCGGLLPFLFGVVVLLAGVSVGWGAEHAVATTSQGAVDPSLAGVASQIQHEYTLGKQFMYSYLTAFMFFLSICLGSLFL